jgi:16S rRNA (cytosine967-C5)-methyltransferase
MATAKQSQDRIVQEVISQSNRENPADMVLRDALASRRLPTAEERHEISRTVFNYFRWFGWLNPKQPLSVQTKHALDLAAGFAERPESFSDDKLIERSVPAWVREQMDVSATWIRAIQSEPRLWLRAQRGQGPNLVEKLGAARVEKELLPDVVQYKGEEDLFHRPEFHAGDFEIQDVGSQAVGWLCSPQPAETWWDACAGEGGKTLHLSALMENKGLIWASDRAEWRLKQLKRRAARAKVFNFRAAPWDGSVKLPTKTKFDGIVVDAPCSGLGTWQRNPHARWTTSPQDVSELAAVQKQLLANVAGSLKPGGKLIYAVCTLTRAENSEVVADFNARFKDFEPVTLPLIPGSQKLIPTGPEITIWPQDLGGNGMFVAAWRRKA